MTRISRIGPALVGLLALLWGSNFVWIKVALEGLSPVQLTFLRLASGAAVLGIVVWFRHEHIPRDHRFVLHLVVAALLANAVPYLLFAIGEQTVDSGLAGIIGATTPLWTVLVALAAHQEGRPTAAKAGGLILGFVGVALILEPWSGNASGSVGGQLACLAAAGSYGLSYVYMARHLAQRQVTAFVLAFGQMTAAAVLLLPALALSGVGDMEWSGSVTWAMVALGPVGTGVAYAINYAIIARDGATVASTVTYLLPVVAASLGAIALEEPISLAMVSGTAVVLGGVALTRRARTHEVPQLSADGALS